MVTKHKSISVFEHEVLRIDKGEKLISIEQLDALRAFHGEKGTPYFSLIHNGVKFNEYVGVLQVGHLSIEILPKADKNNDIHEWRRVLIEMLRMVGMTDVIITGKSFLSLKTNKILDVYIELFLIELERLMHKGLVKRYRKTESNLLALKGAVQFSRHVQQNSIHKERFYVRYTTYDKEHEFNQVLYKTLLLIEQINTNPLLHSRIATAHLEFPELSHIVVNKAWFDRVRYTRKTESYQNALTIARLLLLNFHPDIRTGRNYVLALLFDMNALWERFVYVSLKKHLKDYTLIAQKVKPYWIANGKRAVNIKPDIVINKGNKSYVIDTKWKVLDKVRPADSDLQQMYAYTKYFQTSHTLLIYPGLESGIYNAAFYDEESGTARYPCSIMTIGLDVKNSIPNWQKHISNNVVQFLEEGTK